MKIVGLCDDSFYDQLVTHPEIRSTYLNWTADLRTGMMIRVDYPRAG